MSSIIDGLQRILRTAPPNQIFVLTTAINFINSHTESLAREAAQAQQLRALQAEIEEHRQENVELRQEIAATNSKLINNMNSRSAAQAQQIAALQARFDALKEENMALLADNTHMGFVIADIKDAIDAYDDESNDDEPAVRLVEVIGPAASDPDDAIEIPPWRPE